MDEIKWIERFLEYPDLDECQIININRFALIWNLVEKNCFGTNAQINESTTISSEVYETFNNSLLNTVWNYFKERYWNVSVPSEVFDSFVFNKKDKKSFVIKALKNNSTDKKVIIEALLRIIFRLRNNLYHGMKDVAKLYEQNENFKMTNLFLMELLQVKTGRRISEWEHI